jgi:hypothetical protein
MIEEVKETEPFNILTTPYVPFSASVDLINNNPEYVSKIKLRGYSGEQCTTCHSLRVRINGTCLICDDCGTTTGCS